MVAILVSRIQQDSVMESLREVEEVLQAEKEPNLYQNGTPTASCSSAGYLAELDEESAPLLV